MNICGQSNFKYISSFPSHPSRSFWNVTQWGLSPILKIVLIFKRWLTWNQAVWHQVTLSAMIHLESSQKTGCTSGHGYQANLILIHSQILFHRWLGISCTSEAQLKLRHRRNGVKTPRARLVWAKGEKKEPVSSGRPHNIIHKKVPTCRTLSDISRSTFQSTDITAASIGTFYHVFTCCASSRHLQTLSVPKHQHLHWPFFLIYCHSFTTMTCLQCLKGDGKPQNPFCWLSHFSRLNLGTFSSLLISSINWRKWEKVKPISKAIKSQLGIMGPFWGNILQQVNALILND